jgi:spermidine synthase
MPNNMSIMYEELANEQTSIGNLVLRRRRVRQDGDDIWEIMLDDGYLMSSQFIDGEVALATMGLAMVEGRDLRVVVGGLGLGYTAKAALDDPRITSLSVIELIPEVIGWHREHLLPLGSPLTSDPRCRLHQGDFFALAQQRHGHGLTTDDSQLDAILVDIDHSTRHLIDDANADYYVAEALRNTVAQLRHGGVFALWSSGAEEPEFVDAMRLCLDDVRAERVEFFNPYGEEPAFNIIYLGRRPFN